MSNKKKLIIGIGILILIPIGLYIYVISELPTKIFKENMGFSIPNPINITTIYPGGFQDYNYLNIWKFNETQKEEIIKELKPIEYEIVDDKIKEAFYITPDDVKGLYRENILKSNLLKEENYYAISENKSILRIVIFKVETCELYYISADKN